MADDFTEELAALVPARLIRLIEKQDGVSQVLASLPRTFARDALGKESDERRAWELCGICYVSMGRLHEAFAVFQSLYDQMLKLQASRKRRVHKGVPLFWMFECHNRFGNPVSAKWFLMLALCEDAISEKGTITPTTTGTYHRLVWVYGMTHQQVSSYVQEVWSKYRSNRTEGRFPEWIIQELDQKWMTESPSIKEATAYHANEYYVRHLMSQFGKSKGKSLERLAQYLISAMPGCRAQVRKRTRSTDYDVLGVIEGNFNDFRSEIGRYFICECKDWKKAADFATLAKFCRVLDSTKTRFGILFSKNGISGEGKTLYAEREVFKVFQDRGIVVVVISENDLRQIVDGVSFTLLRDKYERVRFDLVD